MSHCRWAFSSRTKGVAGGTLEAGGGDDWGGGSVFSSITHRHRITPVPRRQAAIPGRFKTVCTSLLPSRDDLFGLFRVVLHAEPSRQFFRTNRPNVRWQSFRAPCRRRIASHAVLGGCMILWHLLRRFIRSRC